MYITQAIGQKIHDVSVTLSLIGLAVVYFHMLKFLSYIDTLIFVEVRFQSQLGSLMVTHSASQLT